MTRPRRLKHLKVFLKSFTGFWQCIKSYSRSRPVARDVVCPVREKNVVTVIWGVSVDY